MTLTYYFFSGHQSPDDECHENRIDSIGNFGLATVGPTEMEDAFIPIYVPSPGWLGKTESLVCLSRSISGRWLDIEP